MPTDVSRQTYPFSLPDLPYAYEALEPHLDAATMRIHHREHHATYVKKLNDALAKESELHRLTLAQLLGDTSRLHEGIRTAVRNNGGGHLNHDLFWKTMAPDSASASPRSARGALGDAVNSQFGSFDNFVKKFSEASAGHFASGWVALSLDHVSKKLAIVDLKEAFPKAKIEEIDGVTLDMGKWWLNVRPSNTEPLLRLNLEGPDRKTVDELVEDVSQFLGKRVAH